MVLRLIRTAAILIANGYVLFFFSERVFWSFWRPGDTLSEFLITWFAYCLLGWIFLDLVRRFKVAAFLPLFLCGAVVGWVDEGVVVDTLYGNSTNPFPLSILATIVLWGLVAAVFLAARVPARPSAVLILPPLLTVCCAGLRRNALTEKRSDVLDAILGRIRLVNVTTLVLIPIAAITVYAVCRTLNLVVPTNLVLCVITMPLGFCFFFRSLWVVFRSKTA